MVGFYLLSHLPASSSGGLISQIVQESCTGISAQLPAGMKSHHKPSKNFFYLISKQGASYFVPFTEILVFKQKHKN